MIPSGLQQLDLTTKTARPRLGPSMYIKVYRPLSILNKRAPMLAASLFLLLQEVKHGSTRRGSNSFIGVVQGPLE